MTYKPATMNHKPWSSNGASAASSTGFFAKLRNMVKLEVPVGYQDENGFHLGVKSAEKEVKWPSVW